MGKFKEIMTEANDILEKSKNKDELKLKVQNLIAENSEEIINELKEGEKYEK